MYNERGIYDAVKLVCKVIFALFLLKLFIAILIAVAIGR